MTRSINTPICVSVSPLPRILALRRVGEVHTVNRAPFLVNETQVVVIPGITGAPYIDQCAAVYQHDLDLPSSSER